MTAAAAEDPVDYLVRWKLGGVLPGQHRGAHAGAGHEVRSVVPLTSHPDPRRLDLRATLRDPFQQLWVRDFKQSAALDVYVLADVSASMGFLGRHDKFAVLGEVVVTLARSAWRSGDRFGVAAADESLRPELSLPARVNRGAAQWLERRFAEFKPSGRGASGLMQAVAQLPARRALVFLISDFNWPVAERRALLQTLIRHDVVPLVLWDPTEADELPARGIVRLNDLEGGGERFVWLRPTLRERLCQTYRERAEDLRRACGVTGRKPFFIKGRFQPRQLTRYFLGAA